VLAALERAQRQRPSGPGPVTLATLLAHLGIVRRSSGSRTVRARLETMIEEGAVERSLRHGVEVFALPPEAARRGRRRRERAAASLPESPQHRAWREARAIAGHELPRLATTLHAALRDALDALDSRVPLHSDAWLLTAERLREECRRLGSAIHCLHEWEEPDERSADVDERSEPWDGGLDPELRARLRWLRAGRRNVTLWRAR
jgi:hypothetical protein